MIGNETIESFLKCKLKAYKQFDRKENRNSEYEELLSQIKFNNKKKYIECNIKKRDLDISSDLDLSEWSKITKPLVIIDASARNTYFYLKFDFLSILFNDSNDFNIIPEWIIAQEKITPLIKYKFAAICLLLNKLMGKDTVNSFKIIYGKYLKTSTFKLEIYLRNSKDILEQITKLINAKKTPEFWQCKYCNTCYYQIDCKKSLLERGDLSLLGGISQKEINKIKSTGIFSIYQFSFTYKPRKSRKSTSPERLNYALKALAIKENRIYVNKIPTIPESDTQIYLDIEALTDEGFIYLIGVVIIKENEVNRYSFWADLWQNQEQLLKDFFALLAKHKDYKIYHYGNYELIFFNRINKNLDNKFSNEIIDIEQHSINLLQLISNQLYLPTYTNGLKEIANYLGFFWKANNASGIQSVIQRKKWELTKNTDYKKWLISYNIDDCEALVVLRNWLLQVKINLNSKNENYKDINDLPKAHYQKWGDPNFQSTNYEVINKAAYFDYQREKIYLRTNKKVKKAIAKLSDNASHNHNEIKINKYSTDYLPAFCPRCNHNQFYRLNERQKLVIDLKFTENGIKKWVIRILGNVFQCTNCSQKFAIDKYGRNLKIWFVNQHIRYLVSMSKIHKMLLDYFNLWIPYHILSEFKPELATEYLITYEQILKSLTTGSLIQIDETKSIVMENQNGYVWVFANMESVIYIYRENREAGFLKDLLNEFKGVLISDFYKGYESVRCVQQKCLVHLIRDLNNDLLNNQSNTEYIEMVQKFGEILKDIIVTIDKYGLRKRNLNKHKKYSKDFFAKLEEKEYSSELANKWKRRLLRNRNKLFNFLDYNDIPWNNNNAENAIKPFAKYRALTKGTLREKGLKDYLILLSIEQTCKYRGINFFEFLKSKKFEMSLE